MPSDMRSPRPKAAAALRRQIVAYLAAHPRALDTLDGIARWWVEDDPKAVEPVLAQLEHRGIVRRRELGAAVYFSLDPRHHGRDADAILAAADKDAHGHEARARRR